MENHKVRMNRDMLSVLQNHLLGLFPSTEEKDWNKKHSVYDVTIDEDNNSVNKYSKLREETNTKEKEIKEKNITESEKKVELLKLIKEYNEKQKAISEEEVTLDMPNRGWEYIKDNFKVSLSSYIKALDKTRENKRGESKDLINANDIRTDLMRERLIHKRITELKVSFNIEE